MAEFVALDYSIVVAGVNMSTHLTSVELPIERDTQESTGFGSTWRSRKGGLLDASVTLHFKQDFAAGEVDATLWPIITAADPTTTVVVKPTSAAVSATNPSYTAPVVVTGFTPINGSVGDLVTMDVTWPTSGAVTRTTT